MQNCEFRPELFELDQELTPNFYVATFLPLGKKYFVKAVMTSDIIDAEELFLAL